jgi:xanthine/uracil/vitamin C permease (AzgA family)
LISYPILKLAGGRPREVRPIMYILAGVLLLYFLGVRR